MSGHTRPSTTRDAEVEREAKRDGGGDDARDGDALGVEPEDVEVEHEVEAPARAEAPRLQRRAPPAVRRQAARRREQRSERAQLRGAHHQRHRDEERPHWLGREQPAMSVCPGASSSPANSATRSDNWSRRRMLVWNGVSPDTAAAPSPRRAYQEEAARQRHGLVDIRGRGHDAVARLRPRALGDECVGALHARARATRHCCAICASTTAGNFGAAGGRRARAAGEVRSSSPQTPT